MSDGDNDDLILVGAKKQVEGKSLQYELAGSVFGYRITRRSLPDLRDGVVDRVCKCR